MNAMMALYDSELRDEMFTLLELAEIKNYTQFIGLNGSSEHGKKESSVAWPGSNEIILLILDARQRERFSQIVAQYKEERTPRPGLLIFDWALSEVK